MSYPQPPFDPSQMPAAPQMPGAGYTQAPNYGTLPNLGAPTEPTLGGPNSGYAPNAGYAPNYGAMPNLGAPAPPMPVGPNPGYPAMPQSAPVMMQPVVPYLGTLTLMPGATLPAHLVADYASKTTDDCHALYKATKGFGCNKEKVISILQPLTPVQREHLKLTYVREMGSDLSSLLDKELSSNLRDLVHGLLLGPLQHDASILKTALKGIGTKEDLLNEVLLGRSNEDMQNLKLAYKDHTGRALDKDVQSDLSGMVLKLFNISLAGQREPDYGIPDPTSEAVATDVQTLVKATGIDDNSTLAVIKVLVHRSSGHLRAVTKAYETQRSKTLTRSIKSLYTGHLRDAMLHIVKGVKEPKNADGKRFAPDVWRDVKYIELSMKGLGTQDDRLIARILRASWDPARAHQIREAYLQKYGKKIGRRISGETSGEYKTLLMALIGEPEKKK